MGTLKKPLLWIGLFAAVSIAFFLSPYASSSPDGLNRVAEDLGFTARETRVDVGWSTPFSGYSLKNMGEGAMSTRIAGLAGVALTYAVAYGLAQWISFVKKRRG